MKERLVELLKKTRCNKDCSGFGKSEFCKGCSSYERFVKSADYLLENGVIVPPCKVGDVVYFVGRNNGKPMGTIDELVIVGIEKTEQGFNAKAKFKDNENVFKILDFSIDNYGFFSTREQAQAKLKEFAERLKEKADRGFWQEHSYVDVDEIDNLVKEMVGDK